MQSLGNNIRFNGETRIKFLTSIDNKEKHSENRSLIIVIKIITISMNHASDNWKFWTTQNPFMIELYE